MQHIRRAVIKDIDGKSAEEGSGSTGEIGTEKCRIELKSGVRVFSRKPSNETAEESGTFESPRGDQGPSVSSPLAAFPAIGAPWPWGGGCCCWEAMDTSAISFSKSGRQYSLPERTTNWSPFWSVRPHTTQAKQATWNTCSRARITSSLGAIEPRQPAHLTPNSLRTKQRRRSGRPTNDSSRAHHDV